MKEQRTVDRQHDPDRRRTPTPILSRYWLRGRRRRARPGEYVDRYRPGEWALVFGVIIFCLIDLVLTLVYLAAGGEEANPLMQITLDWGTGYFIAVKMGITTFGMLFLLLHIRFKRVRALATILLILYAGLILYHLTCTVPGQSRRNSPPIPTILPGAKSSE